MATEVVRLPPHVEGEKSLRVFDLPRARLFSQLLISFEHLANTAGSDRMTVTDQKRRIAAEDAQTTPDANRPAIMAAALKLIDSASKGLFTTPGP